MRRSQPVSNSTDEYWEVDGVSLQTYAFNVVSLGGKWGAPKFRGKDRQFAYKAGSAHRPRTVDEGSLQLGMWVIGADEAGLVPSNRRALFGDNMKKLRQLLWKSDGAEFAITKRWYDSGGLHVATGHGMIPDGIDTAMEGGPYRGKLVLDIHMADPFFYGAQQTVTVPLGAPTVITNPGDERTTAIIVEFNGQLVNPVLTNTTPNPDVWLKVGTSVAVGDKVTVDVDQTTVVRTSDSANLIGAVTHSGSRAWMGLQRGANSLTLATDVGTGTATVKFQPMYF
jgi:hypothetical protein